MEPRSGIIFCKNRPDPTSQSSLKPSILPSMIYNPYLHVWPLSNRVRRVNRMRLEGVWGCLEDVWKVLKVDPNFFGRPLIFHDKFFTHRIFRYRIRPTNNFLNQKFFWPNFIVPKYFLTYVLSGQNFFDSKFFWTQIILVNIFLCSNSFTPIFFGPQVVLDTKFVQTRIFLGPKHFQTNNFFLTHILNPNFWAKIFLIEIFFH